jgi:hypothetical protein
MPMYHNGMLNNRIELFFSSNTVEQIVEDKKRAAQKIHNSNKA